MFNYERKAHRAKLNDWLRLGNNNNWNKFCMRTDLQTHPKDYHFIDVSIFDKEFNNFQNEINQTTVHQTDLLGFTPDGKTPMLDFNDEADLLNSPALDYFEGHTKGYGLYTNQYILGEDNEFHDVLDKYHSDLKPKIFKSLNDILDNLAFYEKLDSLKEVSMSTLLTIVDLDKFSKYLKTDKYDIDTIISIDDCYDKTLQLLTLPSEAPSESDKIENEEVVDYTTKFYYDYGDSIDDFIIYTLKKWTKVNAASQYGLDLLANKVKVDGQEISLQEGILKTLQAFIDYKKLADKEPEFEPVRRSLEMKDNSLSRMHPDGSVSIKINHAVDEDENQKRIDAFHKDCEKWNTQLDELNRKRWNLFSQIYREMDI